MIETLRQEDLVPMHSAVAGLGLTTLRALEAGEVLGVSHIYDERFADGYIRTFLGSLINHSDEPNCTYIGDDIKWLVTTERVSPGKELLIKYGEVKGL